MTNEFDAISRRGPNNLNTPEESRVNAQALELLKAELSTAKANVIGEDGESPTGHKSTKALFSNDGEDAVLVKEEKEKVLQFGDKDFDKKNVKDLSILKGSEPLHKVPVSPWSELATRHGTMLSIEAPVTAGLAVGSFLTRNTRLLGSRAMMLGALAVGADVLYRTASTLQGDRVNNVYSDSFSAAIKDFQQNFRWTKSS